MFAISSNEGPIGAYRRSNSQTTRMKVQNSDLDNTILFATLNFVLAITTLALITLMVCCLFKPPMWDTRRKFELAGTAGDACSADGDLWMPRAKNLPTTTPRDGQQNAVLTV
jgi:hypothetical protein